MRTYVGVTGGLFGLVVVAHIWRMVVEPGTRDIAYIDLTVISAALAGWALSLLRPSSPQG
jgi:hypothetical protein